MAAQMHPAHAPGFVQMRIGPFQSFAPLPQQALSTGAPNPSPIGIDRVPGRRLALPRAPPAIRLRHRTPDVQLSERHHRLVTVIPLVRHDLGQASLRRQDRCDLFGGP